YTVIKTAILYALVGLFHFVFRKKFLAISIGAHNGSVESIPNVKLWDFLFYTSFGFVVTSSVAIAGVLLVFSYLIVPSVAAMLFTYSIGKRLAIGWREDGDPFQGHSELSRGAQSHPRGAGADGPHRRAARA